MAHKKGQGSSRNGRDSNSQRLGVKVFVRQAATGVSSASKAMSRLPRRRSGKTMLVDIRDVVGLHEQLGAQQVTDLARALSLAPPDPQRVFELAVSVLRRSIDFEKLRGAQHAMEAARLPPLAANAKLS